MGMINCENFFCIYYDMGKCMLENIDLSIEGLCSDCIYIDIDEDELKRLRKEKLDRYI